MSQKHENSDIPERLYMDDPNTSWKTQKPVYKTADEKYLKERMMKHKSGSLEKIVENLVKTWEMESTHKIDITHWGTIDKDKYTMNVNGIRTFSGADNIKMGNYNMLMFDSPLYDARKETNESSHKVFRTAFPGGFGWELMEAFSGPPKISFTWRHWATYEGPFKEHQPTGEQIELYGMCIAKVNSDMKIQSLSIYYDPNPFLMKLMRKSNVTEALAKAMKDSCPFAKK